MRILIVEDEKVICEQLRRYFVDKGFAVDVAHTATDGEHIGKKYPVDAAIIDIGLPDFSSIELIKRLRQHHVKVPILIVTKPFEYAELLACINALIRRSVGLAHPELTHNDIITINTVAQEIFVAGRK